MNNPVRFYSTKDHYGCFSNFSRHSVTIRGRTYNTTEHFFQSQKFIGTDPEWSEAIATAESPKKAAEMGRDRSHPIRSDWEEKKDDIMRFACLCKFMQHQSCRETLRSTNNQPLIEATTDDYYWGEGTKQTGKNMLGIILMEIRSLFQKEKEKGMLYESVDGLLTVKVDEDCPIIEYSTRVMKNLGFI